MKILFLIILCAATIAEASNHSSALILSKKFNNETRTLLAEHREIWGEELSSNENTQELRDKNEQGRKKRETLRKKHYEAFLTRAPTHFSIKQLNAARAALNAEVKKLHAEYHTIAGERYSLPIKTFIDVEVLRIVTMGAITMRKELRNTYKAYFRSPAPEELSIKKLATVTEVLGNISLPVIPEIDPTLTINGRTLCFIASNPSTSWSAQQIKATNKRIHELTSPFIDEIMSEGHFPDFFRKPLTQIEAGRVIYKQILLRQIFADSQHPQEF